MTVKIALIDSGVNATHPHVAGQGLVVQGPGIDEDGILREDATGPDVLGHGTAAAAAILDLAPGSELLSIQIFRTVPACPFEHVLGALDFAIAHGAELINLSLGTTRRVWLEPLRERIKRAREAGCELIAPGTFQGLPSFPGSLEGVTGVLMDADLPRDRPVQRAHGKRSFWYASPYPRELPNLPRESNLVGVSMSCANLTGYLARSRSL